jgi:lysyl-tRNA synthetase
MISGSPKEMLAWLDAVEKHMEKHMPPVPDGSDIVILTGNSPDGTLHVGALREIVLADAIARFLRSRGHAVRLIFASYDRDPLKQLYPGLPPAYGEYVGTPLNEIPALKGGHSSFAAENEAPFLVALEELGIEHHTQRIADLYGEDSVMERARQRYECHEELLMQSPAPYLLARCPSCRRLGFRCRVGLTQLEDECRRCGKPGTAEVSPADTKLSWPFEWAAVWEHTGPLLEPMGSTHLGPNGAYEQAKRLAEAVFNVVPPMEIYFDWLHLKLAGKAAANCKPYLVAECCQRNVAYSYKDWARISFPEVLRWSMLRKPPTETALLDLGVGLIGRHSEYARIEQLLAAGADDTSDLARELLRSGPQWTPRFPVSPMKMLRALKSASGEITLTGSEPIGEQQQTERLLAWMEEYGPAEWRSKIRIDFRDVSLVLTHEERLGCAAFLRGVLEGDPLSECLAIGAEAAGSAVRALYAPIYRLLTGRPAGPRLSSLLDDLPPQHLQRCLDVCLVSDSPDERERLTEEPSGDQGIVGMLADQ